MVELNAIHGRRFARAGDEYYLGSDLFMDGQSSVNSIALTGKAHVHEHKLRSMLYGQCDGPLRGGGNAAYRHAHVLYLHPQTFGDAIFIVHHQHTIGKRRHATGAGRVISVIIPPSLLIFIMPLSCVTRPLTMRVPSPAFSSPWSANVAAQPSSATVKITCSVSSLCARVTVTVPLPFGKACFGDLVTSSVTSRPNGMAKSRLTFSVQASITS